VRRPDLREEGLTRRRLLIWPTLTGACIVRLATNRPRFIWAKQRDLANELLAPATAPRQSLAPLPLWEECNRACPRQQLCGYGKHRRNVPPGTITAACFPGRYAKDYRWATWHPPVLRWHSAKPRLSGRRGAHAGPNT